MHIFSSQQENLISSNAEPWKEKKKKEREDFVCGETQTVAGVSTSELLFSSSSFTVNSSFDSRGMPGDSRTSLAGDAERGVTDNNLVTPEPSEG